MCGRPNKCTDGKSYIQDVINVFHLCWKVVYLYLKHCVMYNIVYLDKITFLLVRIFYCKFRAQHLRIYSMRNMEHIVVYHDNTYSLYGYLSYFMKVMYVRTSKEKHR